MSAAREAEAEAISLFGGFAGRCRIALALLQFENPAEGLAGVGGERVRDDASVERDWLDGVLPLGKHLPHQHFHARHRYHSNQQECGVQVNATQFPLRDDFRASQRTDVLLRSISAGIS